MFGAPNLPIDTPLAATSTGLKGISLYSGDQVKITRDDQFYKFKDILCYHGAADQIPGYIGRRMALSNQGRVVSTMPEIDSGSFGFASLYRDRVILAALVALVLASIPLLIPVLDESLRQFYGRNIIDVPFLVGALLAMRLRLRWVTDAAERRFWNLLMLADAMWLLALALRPAVAVLLPGEGAMAAFVLNAPYLVDYACLALALEVHPHVRNDPVAHKLRGLDRAGSFILVLGLFLYFMLVPGMSSGEVSAFWVSSFALFVALDIYIVLRLWHLQALAATPEWRTVYRWILLAVAVWGTEDVLVALRYEGLLERPNGTAFDLLVPVSLFAMLVAARQAVVRPREDEEQGLTVAHEPHGVGPLVAYTLTPLVLHVSLYRFGLPDPAFSLMREGLALGMTAVLAALTLAYHRLLRVENERLAAAETLARESLAHQANHDELTGLPNRNMFRDRLQQAIAGSNRYRSKCAVLFCDLDQFKVINDSLGHEAGDETLVAIALRLRALLRKQDTVARLGGDEFAIVVQRVQHAPDVAVLAEKLLAAISQPLQVQHKNHVLTASLGIAVYPDDGGDEGTLLKHADTAMYQSKLDGRNTYRLFTEAMNDAADERLAIEQGLRSGLIEDRFAVFYQPIVGLETGESVGYEALLRWNHPERGYISPVSFIDVAEQTGLIEPIGAWVLETACTWAAEMETAAAAYISVNVSARQFRDPGLAHKISGVLQQTGLPPSKLQIEITESMALSIDSASSTLRELRSMGVRIAIDDFGTGYAALSVLQNLAVDVVKIDRSFVQGVDSNSVNEAIIRAIVSMARALDFYVVAEGVESEAELEVIRRAQCDAAQGFYFSRTQSADELPGTESFRELLSG